MPYSPPYAGGWKDYPNTTTPITAASLNTMDSGITEASNALPYINRYARAKRTAGNLTLNSTNWADVSTLLDLTLTAASGDVIEYGISGAMPNTTAVSVGFDVVTVVSASPVNSFALDAAVQAAYTNNNGIAAWFCNTGAASVLAGNVYRTLVSGDVSGGNVLLRLRYAESAATNRVLSASTTQPLEVWARNLGPVR